MERNLFRTALDFETVRVRLLYEQSFFTQTAGLANAAIFLYIFKDILSPNEAWSWGGSFFAIYLARIGIQNYFLKSMSSGKEPAQPALWELLFALGILASGIHWLIAGTFLLPDSIVHQAFLGFLLAGTTAGAVVAYCISLRTVFLFLLPAILPFSIKLILLGQPIQYSMGAMLILYVCLITMLVFRMNKYVTNSIRLQFEKDKLLNELRETQTKVIHSTKMAALGEMAGGIAHEINNPLSTIQFNLTALKDMAEAGKLTNENLFGILKRVENIVVRIAKIISGLKSFARDGGQDPPQIVPVKQVIEETLDLCRTRFQIHNISLTVDSIPESLAIECRRIQISQVLLNILNNAFDAVNGQSHPWIKIECFDNNNEVTIAVTDSGPGVPPEAQDKIMQPFFTTKDIGKGTGLGLSISHGIISEHKGSILLDTASAHTRFLITLPKKNFTPLRTAV